MNKAEEKREPMRVVITDVTYHLAAPDEPVTYTEFYRARTSEETEHMIALKDACKGAAGAETLEPFHVVRYRPEDSADVYQDETWTPVTDSYYIYATPEVQDALWLVKSAWDDMADRIHSHNLEKDGLRHQISSLDLQLQAREQQLEHHKATIDSHARWIQYYRNPSMFKRILIAIFNWR